MKHNYLFSCGMGDNHHGICFLMDEKTMRVHSVAGKPTHMDILNFPTSYYNPCQKDRLNIVCVVYDTTSSKFSLWVNHGKICDFTWCLSIKPSTLNLFNRVTHFIWSHLVSSVISIWPDPEMKSSFVTRWHHERTRHWINWFTLSILHSLVLKNLQRLIGILRCNRWIQHLPISCKMDWLINMNLIVLYIVWKLWDLKLPIHDWKGKYTVRCHWTYYHIDDALVLYRCLFRCVRICIWDAYFAPSMIWFPYELKKIFDRILHKLQYLRREHPHHFTLDIDQLDRILEYLFILSSSYSFPVTSIKFDTLGFLWLHRDSPPYLQSLLEKLIDGLSEERSRPPPLCSIAPTTV